MGCSAASRIGRRRGGVSHDLITDADIASERAAVAAIKAAYPDHVVLGEENAASPPPENPASEPSLWIIDPIDGTTNFAHGLPHFAISIAYYEHGQPIAGVVANPARDECFEASRGGGAFHVAPFSDAEHQVTGQTRTPLHVATETSLSEVIVGCGFYYDRGPMMKATLAAIEEVFGRGIHGIRRMGTASLDLCMVAAGQYGAFFEYQLQPWDYAAGRLIVEEAGGRISTATDEPVPLAATSMLASNGHVHDELATILKRHAI